MKPKIGMWAGAVIFPAAYLADRFFGFDDGGVVLLLMVSGGMMGAAIGGALDAG